MHAVLTLFLSQAHDLGSDRAQGSVLIEIEERHVLKCRYGIWLDLGEAEPNHFACFAEVPINRFQSDLCCILWHDDLPLACLDVAGVEIAILEMREQLLTRRSVVSIWSCEHGRNVMHSQGFHGLFTCVIRRVIKDNHS